MPRHAIHLGTAWEPPTATTPAWVRRFGRPAGLEPGDRLLLVCEHPGAASLMRIATLNGRSLEWREPHPGVLESDVSGLLDVRNQLVVPAAGDDVAAGHGAGGRASWPTEWGRLSLVVVSD